MPDVPFGHTANVTSFWYLYPQLTSLCSSTNRKN